MAYDWNWTDLCNEEELVIWKNYDFGQCFEYLAVVCPVYILFALISSYYIGNRSKSVRRFQYSSYVVIFRLVISLSLLVSPIIELVLQVFYARTEIIVMHYVAYAIMMFGWLLHLGYMFNLRNGITVHSRGPVLVILAWILTFVVTVIQVRTFIAHPAQSLSETIGKYMTYLTAAFQVLYLSTLIPKGRGQEVSRHHLVTVNVDDERQPLLSSSRSYGETYTQLSNPVWSDLGVATDGYNVLSKLVFRWVQPLMLKGAAELLQSPDDLFELPHGLRTSFIDTKFWILYKDLQLRANAKRRFLAVDASPAIVPRVQKKSVSLTKALFLCFGREYFCLGFLKLFADVVTFLNPLLLNALLDFLEEGRSKDSWTGYYYVAGLFASTLVSAVLNTQFQYHINNVGLKIRAAIITTVYRKSLHSNMAAMMKLSVGEIVNYMSTDSERIQNFCPSFHQFWSLPIQIGICLYLLYLQVGLAFLAGLGFAILLIPINRYIANWIGQLSSKMMNQKDKRVKMMNELLNGIKVIKLNAWEIHFKTWITELRNAELKSLKGRKYLDAACVYFWATTPVLISVLTFTAYTLLGNSLTASKVFTSIALFNILIMPLNAFPWVLNGLMEAWISVKRLQKLMLLYEVNYADYYSNNKDLPQSDEDDNFQILMDDSTFSWNEEERIASDNNLESIPDLLQSDASDRGFKLGPLSLKIQTGQLIGVVGQVGTGKTTFLHAIQAEMWKESGDIYLSDVTDGFGYVSQEVWLQQGTIKDNILFGKSYDFALYKEVMEACALTNDIQVLPLGDETEVGEKGMTLSGGQKARIALARAAYQDKDVYLMDDPLSAVDVKVAKHIFENCIMRVLKDKTRIICTHQVKFLQQADYILVFQNGKIVEQGLPSEIFSSSTNIFGIVKDVETNVHCEPLMNDTEKANPKPDNDIPNDICQSLILDEDREQGSVKFSVYRYYWVAVGAVLAPFILLSITLMQASRNATDIWLAHWVSMTSSSHNGTNSSSYDALSAFIKLLSVPVQNHNDENVYNISNIEENQTDNVQYYLMIYGIIVGLNSIFTLLRAFLFAYGGVIAACNIHVSLLNSILLAPISFFERNPIGRILNRFSSDLYTVDDSLPFNLNIFLAQTFGLLGILFVTCYSLPWILLLVIPLSVIYFNIQHNYRYTSRAVKRLSAVTLSPIYAHFSETLSGLVTVRAFRSEARFKKKNEEYLEKNQRANFANQAASQWLSLRLQLIGVLLVTGIGLLAVLESGHSVGLIGLAISYALSVTSLLNGVVWSFTETEKEMVSAERAMEYIDGLDTERWDGIIKPPPGWPQMGGITFQNVYLKYREHLPYALANITIEINPGEKVGIIGRTGSGKSSLFQALFRTVEIFKGKIFIDETNIEHLDLHDLRSSLAIIPQDPFLFSGTVKNNLDPFNRCDESKLYEVLQTCHLTDLVLALGGLNGEISEMGRDLSVGQRQLFCLARALLTQAQILCFDEATANVDQQTEKLIQETLRLAFRKNTVLTIAHRIETIWDCDRVLVMSQGKVQEFDSPKKLLSDPESMFYKLSNE